MTGKPVIDITKQLSDFVLTLAFEDLPARVVEEAKSGIMDFLGVALLGSREESTRMISQSCGTTDNAGEATVLGTTARAPAAAAALVNAYAAHAVDYDDTQHDCGTHISAPVLGAALAMAERCHSSGRDLLTAYVAGFEVGCRLGRAARFGDHLQLRGIHGTGFLGHFGAMAAAGRLIGLDSLQMRRGYGISATQAAGLVKSFGSMCKPLNAANAAHNAIRSALLAKQGFTGPEQTFDGDRSIFTTFDGKTDPDALVKDLGRHFEISHNTLKAFACSGGRNPVVEALILLATAHDLLPQDVESISVRLWPQMMQTPNYSEPLTGLESKFSTEHAAAVALTDRAGGIEQFSDARATDPGLADLRHRVSVEAGPELGQYQVRVVVRTGDGRELSHFIAAQKGDPRNPLSANELVAKFSTNASVILPQRQVENLITTVRELDAVTDVAELCRDCSVRE